MCPSSRKGRTAAGFVFELPATTDMFQTLASPAKWGPAEYLTILLVLSQVCTIPVMWLLPRFYFIAVFAFWRLAYNVGIGTLLHVQSKRAVITTWLHALSPSARALVHWASTKSMRNDYSWEKLPSSYNAWIAFRALSMLILTNDGLSYIVLAVNCFNPLHTSPFWKLLICIPTGVALIVLSFWSKGAAHHVLGDFAWYWGDFFFTVDADLKFDGVFELFPHPMYTVGYAAYYGAALICRSHTLLAISLLAHISQLLFLALVEEPHIQKIYGPSSSNSAEERSSAAYEPLTPDRPLRSFSASYDDFMHAAPRLPVITSLAVAFSTVAALAMSSRPSTANAVLLLLSWCVAHWTLLFCALHATDDEFPNRWMRLFSSRGYSAFHAFSAWQHTYLASFVVMHALFLIAASTFGPSKAASSVSVSETISGVLAGFSLTAIAVVSLASTWNDIGYFGFFYGDFFVAPQEHKLRSSGMFRYVTHPEATLGYLAYYGIAFIKQSRALFMLALVCQSLHMMFVVTNESKHIARTYRTARDFTALERAVVTLPIVSTVYKMMHDLFGQLSHYVDTVGKPQAQQTVRQLSVRKERLKADLNKSIANARDKHMKPRTDELRSRAKSVVGDLDCASIVSMLGNRGIRVEPVSQSRVDGQ
ncbi:Phosphatidylethanolamine N-methyltransferase [Gracilaria domingensis]|nr:Phosphatidylethanolamine N-methyltransferase [Gracilaria domingensis]